MREAHQCTASWIVSEVWFKLSLLRWTLPVETHLQIRMKSSLNGMRWFLPQTGITMWVLIIYNGSTTETGKTYTVSSLVQRWHPSFSLVTLKEEHHITSESELKTYTVGVNGQIKLKSRQLVLHSNLNPSRHLSKSTVLSWYNGHHLMTIVRTLLDMKFKYLTAKECNRSPI